MVSRKILIALGVFAVLAIGIASVAAVQNIEVDGIKFTIPDGYTEDMSMAKNGEVDENGFKTFDHTYFDSNYNMLSVTVFYDGNNVDFNSLKGSDDVEKTIKCHKAGLNLIRKVNCTFSHMLIILKLS